MTDMAETVKEECKKQSKSSKKGDPVEGRCQFYMDRKRRHCRTIPPTDSKYCVEHSHLLGDGVKRKRIPCPLDPKHTCYEDQLKNHLKKCNARESAQPEYYCKNINLGTCNEEDKDLKVTIGSVSPEEILNMVERVKTLYAEHVPEIPEELLFHDALKEEIDNPMNGDAAKKHLKQQASLVGHIDKLKLLRDGVCYIEFGAGKAGLSHWVQRAAPDCRKNKYYLVEKGSVRYKMDSYHKGGDQPNFERLRIDIQHLCMEKVAGLRENKDLPIIGIGKHLCGGATDLMLRCLMQQANAVNNSETAVGEVEAIVLALCCHHRCDWLTYTGKQFFTDIGLSAQDLPLLCSMTSWATCATRTFLNKLVERGTEKDEAANNGDAEENGGPETKRTKLENDEDSGANSDEKGAKVEVSEKAASNSEIDPEHEVFEDDTDYQHPRYGSLTPEQREEVGYMCKKLIDIGRIKYIEQHGFNVQLVKYTTSELSLENVALLATRKTAQ